MKNQVLARSGGAGAPLKARTHASTRPSQKGAHARTPRSACPPTRSQPACALPPCAQPECAAVHSRVLWRAFSPPEAPTNKRGDQERKKKTKRKGDMELEREEKD
ncbi:hypothetical protein TIFTF001_016833 [Ficus carica]|uniref:Uncharacterized protein n=1 Tax=Ficus carica TaxID=3494 RepID=A0AA88A3V9_FICCA|nr:hypothetical protein TIFTF001_016833 [Ficus carica]